MESFKIFKSIRGHWINYDFFDIYFLFNNAVSKLDFNIEKNEMKLQSKEDGFMSYILINTRLRSKLDILNVLLKNFKLTIALDFFLIFNFYTIYLRRLRYNYYTRNLTILNEFTRIKVLFILVNNPFGKNKTQVNIFRFQKMYTKKFYNRQMSQERFNKKFKFFLSIFTRRH
jgi:hypothetical protein